MSDCRLSPGFPQIILSPAIRPALNVFSIPINETSKPNSESQTRHVLHPKEVDDASVSPPPMNNKTQTPDALWHSVIEDMDHYQQPLLKAYMQEGRPDSLINGEITIIYDEESESMHITELKKEKALIETCLRRLSGNQSITLNISERKGIFSPREVIHQNPKDLESVRKRADNNPFVKDVLDLFEAQVVDVKG